MLPLHHILTKQLQRESNPRPRIDSPAYLPLYYGAISFACAGRRIPARFQKDGIYLCLLGFGAENLKDNKMEVMAKYGNGNYHYIGDMEDAWKALVQEADSTLIPVADDVKIQVEFNPGMVSEYRLVGYENRLLNAEDFNDDKKDDQDKKEQQQQQQQQQQKKEEEQKKEQQQQQPQMSKENAEQLLNAALQQERQTQKRMQEQQQQQGRKRLRKNW